MIPQRAQTMEKIEDESRNIEIVDDRDEKGSGFDDEDRQDTTYVVEDSYFFSSNDDNDGCLTVILIIASIPALLYWHLA